MTSDAAVPAGVGQVPDPADAHEWVLYVSERTRVLRLRCAGDGEGDGDGRIVRKETYGPGARRRLLHEASMLRRLAGVEGVPQLIGDGFLPGPEQEHRGGALVVRDTGGVTLAEAMASWRPDAGELVRLAGRLAAILAEVHRRGIVHKDINPANIIVAGADRRPELIDFSLATPFTEERPGFTHENEIAGTLPYLAPEQTGRTGRPVDRRADLYALGATLYALATGEPPFGTGDPLGLVHDHLARIPVPPAERNPELPSVLSDIIMRLLEKEPDRRYQTADGLAYDLEHLTTSPDGSLPHLLGRRDFPARLAPPSRLVGREQEIGVLREALADALAGRGRGVLVRGAAGVGKTALLDELRPMATAHGGWFVMGKSDEYRQDPTAGSVGTALGALGRLLLAEPEQELALLRASLYAALGGNAGLVAGLLPEFAVLLDIEPVDVAADDPQQVQARFFRACVDLLRVIVSPVRPVVMVLDDLQWAAPVTFGFIDAVLTDDQLAGLLFVGSLRDTEIDDRHPLSQMGPRWERLGVAPRPIGLENLEADEQVALLTEMLRLPPDGAAALADAMSPHTAGNPYDMVETINALRQDGLLRPGEAGWEWDTGQVRHYVGRGDVSGHLAARIGRLPRPTRSLLAVVSCLGGEADLGLLRAAAGLSAASVAARLLPALEDGLLVPSSEAPPDIGGVQARRGRGRRARPEQSEETIRFRHDRLQRVVFGRLGPQARRGLQFGIARRLARRSGWRYVAAAQYLQAVDLVRTPAERRRVAMLFRDAAAQARITDAALTERLLSAGLRLLDGADDLRPVLEMDRHAALFGLGRMDEGDVLYASVMRRGLPPLVTVDMVCVQISSLHSRGRLREATDLGLDALGRLGLTMGADVEAENDALLDELAEWARQPVTDADLTAPGDSDPVAVAVAKLLSRSLPPSYLCDPEVNTWLTLQGRRLWSRHGALPPLTACVGTAAPMFIDRWDDYRLARANALKALQIGEALGHYAANAWNRQIFDCYIHPWFEPLDRLPGHSRLCHEDLLRAGDILGAAFTFGGSIPVVLDCGPTLDAFEAELGAALSFVARAGNESLAVTWRSYRQLLLALRGETAEPGSFSTPGFDETAQMAEIGANPITLTVFHTNRALAALLFDDTECMGRHSEIALALVPSVPGLLTAFPIHLMRALAVADRLRTMSEPEDEPVGDEEAEAEGPGRAALEAEFGRLRAWLAGRAEDAPFNYRHLLLLVDAERACAAGDFRTAVECFDAAQAAAASLQRPWQRALIAERSARFHRAHGLGYHADRLLREAVSAYASWGATGKVALLEERHPFLRDEEEAAPPAGFRADRTMGTVESARSGMSSKTTVSADAIDLLAVVRASQALSSETNLVRLRARVAEVLGAMTGATIVRLLLRDERNGWFLPVADPEDAAGLGSAARTEDAAGRAGGSLPVQVAGERNLVPLSAFRYAERTREPLLVEDATLDDRFARDPYFAGLDQCSMLVVPVLAHGRSLAVLVLENRHVRGAFRADRLDGVMLVAGQLAVSIENALVYASLEQKVAERTQALEAANAKLETLSTTDPLTGLANRRRLTEEFDAEWRRTVRSGHPIAVAMVDIDHFKLFNDRYGHMAGDACLKRIAGVLTEKVRDSDLVARYGGEEFVIVLRGANLETAHAVAERVRLAVTRLAEPNAGSAEGILTVSVGVAAREGAPGEIAPERLIELADAQLYRAKSAGRNRVMSAQPVR